MTRKTTNILCSAAIISSAVLATAGPAMAQFTIDFDEFGKARVTTTSGGVIPIQTLGNIVDPFDPGSGIKPLAYDLTSVIPGIVPTDGDIFLIEPPVNPTSPPSDLLRWEHGLLLVYSDLPEAGEFPVPPADVGIPTRFQQNILNLIEQGPEAGPNGLFGYAPNVGDPGYYPVPPGPVTYNFLSDPAVPEPTALSVLAVGVGFLAMRRRRRPATAVATATPAAA
jgi:hypothetical protein